MRNIVATIAAAICPASFGTFLWLFFSFFFSRPEHPDPALGFVHPLNNHGSYVYISDTETTELYLLSLTFLAGLGVAIWAAPKSASLVPPPSPRWLTRLFGEPLKPDFAGSRRQWDIIFVCFIAIHLAAIYVVGPTIVRFFVSRGIVLQN